MIFLNILLYLSFIAMGLSLYFYIMCGYFNCKSNTSNGYVNTIPLQGFYIPFKYIFTGKIMAGLKMLISYKNPWIYIIISLILATIFVPYIYTEQKYKQLSMEDLYPNRNKEEIEEENNL